MLLTINEHGSRIARSKIFHCPLSPVKQQMAIKNSVSNVFDLGLTTVLMFSIATALLLISSIHLAMHPRFIVSTQREESISICQILFDLILYVPSTIFQLNRDGSSWVEPVLS